MGLNSRHVTREFDALTVERLPQIQLIVFFFKNIYLHINMVMQNWFAIFFYFVVYYEIIIQM